MSSKKATRFLTRFFATAILMTAGTAAMAGTIAGTAHDFNALAGGNMCLPCHTPHRANTTVVEAPLWNHALTTQTYTLYSSSTLQSVPTQPGGNSKLCLSCHDGSVAINSFGGNTGTTIIGAGGKIGTGSAPSISLKSEHPIGMTYDAALVTLDPSLRAITTAANIGSGGDTKTGTISSNLLFAGKVECASCHDVHNKFTSGGNFLKIAANSLCTTCHAK